MDSYYWRRRTLTIGVAILVAAVSSSCREDPLATHAVRWSPERGIAADTLGHDDGVPEGTWGADRPSSVAAIFTNPFDEPARIEAVWTYLLDCAPAGTAYRMTLWNVDENGKPTTEAQIGTVLLVDPPFDTWKIDSAFDLVVPASARFAAGVQQIAPLRLCVGHDYTSPFHLGTHWFNAVGSTTGWSRYEALDPPILIVPMLRVSLSPASGGPALLAKMD
jgi:hypothetical protein